MKIRKQTSSAIDVAGVTRITVSVPNRDCEQLREIAARKRVSISWVVRDAVNKYLSIQSEGKGITP